MKKALIWLFLTCPFLAPGQFQLNGAASQGAGACYTLTPDQLTVVGSIWSPFKISLDESFQAIFSLYLGCKNDSGADGIVFGFQPVSTSVGQAGGGLGFQNIAPSLGIEFDTWQNGQLGDPANDHIAIARNGDLNHSSANNLAGPVQADPADPNVEDCAFHKVRVDWDAGAQLLRVWFDCSLRLSYSGDIVQEIFGGDPWVYWGFTAGTGAASNLQQVCLDYTTFFQSQPDVRICAGGQVQLQLSGSPSYLWSPPDGLSAANIPNPVAAPGQTTTYVVEMRDACQFPFYDTVTVFVHPDSLRIELGPDTSFCEGTPYLLDATPVNPTQPPAYIWTNGQTGAQIEAWEGGAYGVTASLDANCITQDWIHLTRIDLPLVELGPDTVACAEEPFWIEATGKNADEYLWEGGETSSTLRVTRPGVYRVAAINVCGVDRDTVTIGFRPCESEIYVPNIFTPNHDGINDRAGVMGPEGIGTVEVFRIFDRWGGMVYEELNTPVSPRERGWDGNFRGKPLPAGVYVYVAEIRFLNGEMLRKKGALQLVR